MELNDFEEISPEEGELLDALDNIRAMDHGTAQIAAAEEAVRRADALGLPFPRYAAREELVNAACFGGAPDLLLVHFPWMLARFDADPDGCDAFQLHWKFKWLFKPLCAFPHIPKSKIFAMLGEMERRYAKLGMGGHALAHCRRKALMYMGDLDAAKEAHAAYRKTKRDPLSDCEACVPNEDADYYVAIGEPAKALVAVKEILSGRLRCGEVPHITYATVLMPLLQLRRAAEAMKHHRNGYHLVQNNPGLVVSAGKHASFLALTGNLDRAGVLLNRHLPMLDRTTDLEDHFSFLLDAWIALDRFRETGRTIKLKLPDEVSHDTDPLAWVEGRLTELADAFDARNGNRYFAGRIETARDAKQFASPIAFAAKA